MEKKWENEQNEKKKYIALFPNIIVLTNLR